MSMFVNFAVFLLSSGVSLLKATPILLATSIPDLGIDANTNGFVPFPVTNLWNTPIDNVTAYPVDPNSNSIFSAIGLTTGLHPDFGQTQTYGIPYVVVDSASTPYVNITFTAYGSESDPGPYPVPPNAPVEGGSASTGDRHVLVVNRATNMLYEMYNAVPKKQADGSIIGWSCDSGAVWNMATGAYRPVCWTSADAAGLPIYPGLVKYSEVAAGSINHAIRVTVSRTRRAYVLPATHWASSLTGTQYAPMGARMRLKASFNVSGYPPQAQVILNAMKKYGMIVADNGSNMFFSGSYDSRWNDTQLNTLKNVKASNFEIIKMANIVKTC